MADNPLTTGPNATSGAGENSSSPVQSWDAQQQAIQAANMARQAAAQRAAEAANAAARNRPATGGRPSAFEATGNLSINAHGPAPVGLPTKGKRGK